MIIKMLSHKDMLNVILTRLDETGTSYRCNSKGYCFVISGYVLRKALQIRKETLKGMCLCQVYLFTLVVEFFLMVSQAESHVNFPVSVRSQIG